MNTEFTGMFCSGPFDSWRELRRARHQEHRELRRTFDRCKYWRWRDSVSFYSAVVLIRKVDPVHGFHDHTVLWSGDPNSVSMDDEFNWPIDWQAREKMNEGEIYWVACAESWGRCSYEYEDYDGEVIILQARPWHMVPERKRRQLLGWKTK